MNAETKSESRKPRVRCTGCGADYSARWAGTSCSICDGEIEALGAMTESTAKPAEEKHTPGPWYYDAESQTVRVKEFKRNQFMGDYRGCIIAGFDESHGGKFRQKSLGLRDQIDANARLIAAAPELLEALKATQDALGCYDGHVNNLADKKGWTDETGFEAWVKAEAAIRKATEGK
jgi:hypothetical protein